MQSYYHRYMLRYECHKDSEWDTASLDSVEWEAWLSIVCAVYQEKQLLPQTRNERVSKFLVFAETSGERDEAAIDAFEHLWNVIEVM